MPSQGAARSGHIRRPQAVGEPCADIRSVGGDPQTAATVEGAVVGCHEPALAGDLRVVAGAAPRPERIAGKQEDVPAIGIGAVVGGAGTARRHELQDMAEAVGSSRSEEHTSELQSLMRISYDVFCLKKKT